MERPTPDGVRYQPTINIEKAPRIVAPILYVGTAYGFLGLAALLSINYAPWLARGDYVYPLVIMMVHFFTLGFLSMTAMGILNQWIPVVFDVEPLRVRRVIVNFLLYLVGLLTFEWGFQQHEWGVLAVGGSLLALAILAWSAGVLGQLHRSSKPHDVVYRGIQSAVLGFNLVWVLGVFMALAFLGWWPEYQVLRVHIATALAAWMGLLILTVQQKLNPMFSMSRAEGVNFALPMVLAGGGVLLAWASLVTSPLLIRVGGGLWVGTAVFAGIQLVRVLKQGKSKTFDRVFVGVGAAWLLFLAAAILTVWLNPLAVLVAFWGMLTLILSYQTRILPFMVALVVAKRLPGPVFKAFFMAQAMHSKNQPVIVAVLGLAGAALSVAGRLKGAPAFDAVSGTIILLLIASQIVNGALSMAQGRKRAPARP